jgi:hypothetical protein
MVVICQPWFGDLELVAGATLLDTPGSNDRITWPSSTSISLNQLYRRFFPSSWMWWCSAPDREPLIHCKRIYNV